MQSKQKDADSSIKKAFELARLKADTKAKLERLEEERQRLLLNQEQVKDNIKLQSQMNVAFGGRHQPPMKRKADEAVPEDQPPQKKQQPKPKPRLPKRKPKPQKPKPKSKKSKQKKLSDFFKTA